MILSNNSNPKNSLYYIGGIILSLMKKEKVISFPLYNFALDWLYLISAVEFDEKEGVVKCI